MGSQGWEWLKDQPPAWEAPESLRVPTSSAELNLAVQMLGSNIVGNDIVEAVGDFVAAKARLELWVGRQDPPLPLVRQFAIGRSVSDVVRVAYEAWLRYEEAHRMAGGKVAKIDSERQALLAAVREAAANFTSVCNGEGFSA